MHTNEEIAAYVLEKHVRVEAGQDDGDGYPWSVMFGAYQTWEGYKNLEAAQRYVDDVRAAMKLALVLAIEGATRQLPEPSPVSPDALDEALEDLAIYRSTGRPETQDVLDVADVVVNHLRHLERLLAVLLRDEVGVAYAEGYAAGQKNVRESWQDSVS